MKVIIPLAGEGKRLRPHTHTTPKPLLPVAGKPIIDHIMDALLPLNPTEFWFITGHLRNRMEQHLKDKYTGKTTLHFVEQKEINGTAGAVRLAAEAFDEPVLIDFGDTIFETDLTPVHHCTDDAIIWTMHVEDYQRFGVCVTDKDGYLTKIVEKPKEPVSRNANIGLYYVRNTALLSQGIKHVFDHPIPGREFYLTDAFQYMVEHGAKIKILPCTGWYDCGTSQMLLLTNKELLEKAHAAPPHGLNIITSTIIPPVAIHESARIENSTIGPHVSIGVDAHITNSKISDSIIDARAVIHTAELSESIVGVEAHVRGKIAKVVLGDHSRVE